MRGGARSKLREATGSVFPGYMIHESAAWSETMKKWVFCPRRISSDQYDDVKDEKVVTSIARIGFIGSIGYVVVSPAI